MESLNTLASVKKEADWERERCNLQVCQLPNVIIENQCPRLFDLLFHDTSEALQSPNYKCFVLFLKGLWFILGRGEGKSHFL